MPLLNLITQSKDLAIWLHEKTSDRSVPGGIRERTGISILQLSLDIDEAIIVLIESKLPGPALSLARPLFEGYVRGYWLLRYASDEEVDKFNHGNCPNLHRLLTAISNDAESGGAWIHNNKDANLISFHDLTHGGCEHVKRRNKEDAVEPNYPDQELVSLVKFGIEVRIRVCAELLSLMKDEAAKEELNEKAQTFRALP
jgi:hypothetical protein